MKYTTIPPCKELKDLVRHYWVGTWDVQVGHGNSTHYVVANSSTEITFAFSGDYENSELLFSAVQGHTHLPDQFSVPAFYHLIGVSFYSYAIPLLFGISPTELAKEFISLTTLLGTEGAILNEKIAKAHSTPERIDILASYFLSCLKNTRPIDPLIVQAMKEIKQLRGNVRVGSLADQFCLSQKQFGRRFKAFSGFNPKVYARIIRFESVLASYPSGGNFTDLAYENGYYDQAHFIHELETFTGFKPKEFWKLSEEGP